jgi:hypothetical protein
MKTRPLRPLGYYLDQIPKGQETDFNSVEEAIETYRVWRRKISDYYLPNEKVKAEDPVVYACLINTELKDDEIKEITEEYYREAVIHYSDTLSGADYELD